MQPVITSIDAPLLSGPTIHLYGYGFGRVVGAVIIDVAGKQWEVDCKVDDGYNIHLYIPPLLPDGVYYPQLNTLDNTVSVNQAGNFTLPVVTTPTIAPSVVYTDPVPDTASAATTMIRQRLRMEIGDNATYFQTNAQGDGYSTVFDLPATTSVVSLSATLRPANGNPVPLTPGQDYIVDAASGMLTMMVPPADDTTLAVGGTHYQFFSDSDLDLFVRSAALKHTHNAETLQRYIDTYGFRQYIYSDATVDSIAPVEYHLVSLLAAAEALEVISSDIAYDIDVSTAEGTSMPRTQRFRNIEQKIVSKQMRYDDLCSKLGVGLGRIEVFTMRRVSRQTQRLIPVWVAQEYDQRGGVNNIPLRVLTPRNKGITGEGFDQPDPRAYYSNGGYS